MPLGDFVQYHVPNARCPSCNTELDFAENVDGGGAPEAGNISVCIQCAAVLVFNDDLSFRVPTDEDWQEIKSDLSCLRNLVITQASVRKVHRDRRRANAGKN